MNGDRILIVDDDEASRDILRRLLAHEGWVVTAASCVTEATARLDPPPLFVLLDLMLPDGDGEDVLRKVRDEGLPTRVVVSTGTDDPVRLSLVRGMDADARFPRPIDFPRRRGARGRPDGRDDQPVRQRPASTHPRFIGEGNPT